MTTEARAPLFSRSSVLFWPVALVALPAALALAWSWDASARGGLPVLAWLEGVLVLLVVTLRDPVRFHTAGRALIALVAAGLVAVAAAADQFAGEHVWFARAALAALAAWCSYYVATGRWERLRDPVDVQRAWSGEVTLEGSLLRYRYGDEVWELDSGEIRAVGEWTVDHPGDDYFLCLVTDLDGTWRSLSFYAVNETGLLRWLGEELGGTLEHALCNSTSFDSRVMWPPELVGEPLFAVAEPDPPLGWRERLLALLGLRSAEVFVSPHVLEHLRTRGAGRHGTPRER